MKPPAPADPNRLLLFTIYAFLIGLLAALTPEALKGLLGSSETGVHWHAEIWWLGTLVLIVTLFLMYDPSVKLWFQTVNTLTPLILTSHDKVGPAKGLVLLVSRGEGMNSGIYAVDYHRSALTHLWLIHSSDPGSREGVETIRRHCQEVAPAVVIEPRPLANVFSVEMTKALVESIRKEAYSKGIADADFICDFTGINKPVSAGVVLACVRPGHRLQYMEPKNFLPDGRPDPQAGARPVEVDVNYDVELI